MSMICRADGADLYALRVVDLEQVVDLEPHTAAGRPCLYHYDGL